MSASRRSIESGAIRSRLRRMVRRDREDPAARKDPAARRDGPRATSPAGRSGRGPSSASYPTPEPVGRLLAWTDVLEDRGAPAPDVLGSLGSAACLADDLAAGGHDPERLAFVDIETCGLGDDPIFLVGVLCRRSGAWEARQLLAPDPSAEPELLARSAMWLERHDHWVSFNGRSFDVPRMRRRCGRHGIRWPEAAAHLDLLVAVRRRWRGELPDCRLPTVERERLGILRPGTDVPGREVPDRYWDFVRSGERRWLDPVVDHNRRDVWSLAVLLRELSRPRGEACDQPPEG